MEFFKSSNSMHLQNYYTIFMEIGLIGALSILIFATNINLRPSSSDTTPLFKNQEIVSMKEVIRTDQTKKPPPPPRPQVPVPVSDDKIIEDQNLDFSSELDLNDPLPLPAAPEKPPKGTEETEEPIFVTVEHYPVLIGGLAKLQSKVEYPRKCILARIEGRVFLEFVVNKEGMPEEITILRGIGGGCDEAAIAAVQNYARFEPGRQRGKPVNVKHSLSILFKLEKR